MSDKNRRKLLKSLAAGSGAVIAGKTLPEHWNRPVIESVVLPAHAQTSAALVFYTASAAPGFFLGMNTDQGEESRFASIADSLVPTANAAPGPGNDGFYVCATVDDQAGTAQVAVGGIGGDYSRPLYQTDMLRRGTLKTNGALGEIIAQLADVTPCDTFTQQQRTRSARIAGYTPGDTVIRIQIQTLGNSGGDFVEIEAQMSANGCFPEPPLGDYCTRS
ncbi:MAG TPA: hypothetical protein VJ998_06560 [Pseudomonadales bacterium]|nr:hypothetical protein [Pseudomonadales bacterium]